MKKTLKTRIFCTLKQNLWILRFNAVLHFCTLRGQLFRQQPARRVDKAGPRHRREDQGGCLLKCLLNGPPVGGTQEMAVGIFAFSFLAVDSPFFFFAPSLSLSIFPIDSSASCHLIHASNLSRKTWLLGRWLGDSSALTVDCARQMN